MSTFLYSGHIDSKMNTIIGAGAFGKALALVLKKPMLVDIDKNGTYSEKTKNLIMESDNLFVAVPSCALLDCIAMLKPLLNKQKVIFTTKGLFYEEELKVATQLIPKAGAICGPNLAKEIHKKLPTYAVIGRHDLREEFEPSFFKVYYEKDAEGLLFGSAMKNIYAIGAGILREYYGVCKNTIGAYTYSVIEETKDLYRQVSGKKIPERSFIADLITTTTSKDSRNYQFGRRIAKGEKLEKIIENLKTVEGVHNLRELYKYLMKTKMRAPYAEQIYKVIFQKGSIEKIAQWIYTKE